MRSNRPVPSACKLLALELLRRESSPVANSIISDEPDVVAGQLGNNPHLESLEAHNADPRTSRDSYAGPKFIHQQSALFARLKFFLQTLIRWREYFAVDMQRLPLGDFEHRSVT